MIKILDKPRAIPIIPVEIEENVIETIEPIQKITIDKIDQEVQTELDLMQMYSEFVYDISKLEKTIKNLTEELNDKKDSWDDLLKKIENLTLSNNSKDNDIKELKKYSPSNRCWIL